MRARRLVAAGLAGALIASSPGVAGADGLLDSPVPEVSETEIEWAEVGVESPVRPGIADDTHFTIGTRLPTPTAEGWSWVTDDGDDFRIERIAPDGSVVAEDVFYSGFIDFYHETDVVSDAAFVYRWIDFSGLEVSNTIVGWQGLDRDSVLLASRAEAIEPVQMSDDGVVVATVDDEGPLVAVVNFGVRYVRWEDPAFQPSDLQPQLSTDGTMAAVAGAVAVDGGIGLRGDVWIKPVGIDAEGEDVRVALPCEVGSCEYDVTLFSSAGQRQSVYVTEYEVELSQHSSTTVGANHYVIDVETGSYRETAPASVASSSGRFVAGNVTVGSEVEASETEIEIFDTTTARARTVRAEVPTGYTVTPVWLSDDGLDLRYAVSPPPCQGLCLARDTYFGTVELLPVADATNGPAEDQILRLYRAVFGRIPDAEGFEFWASQYREGRPLLDIAAEFAVSDEFVDRYGADPSDFLLIEALYQNVLGREGESAGIAFWLDQFAEGASVARVLIGFADADENIDRTDTRQPVTVAEGRVLRLYRAVLGREPDAGGRSFWVGEFNSGMELTEMARLFTGQPEYTDLYGASPTNAELVDAVYRNVLGRPGDAGGVDFWLGRLDDGLTVPDLFVEFANSDENVEGTGTVR